MNLEQVITGETTMEAFVAHKFSAFLWDDCGYQPNGERVKRIADAAERLMREGYPARLAYAGALAAELTMYGDPLEKSTKELSL